MDDAQPPAKPQDRQCMYYCRLLLAFISTVLVLVGLSMQVWAPPGTAQQHEIISFSGFGVLWLGVRRGGLCMGCAVAVFLLNA